jgi:hypothetical protein
MRKTRNPFTCETVEARESGCIADADAPGGEWVVRRGTLWRSDHPAVARCPEWFVPMATLQTSAPYFPERAA